MTDQTGCPRCNPAPIDQQETLRLCDACRADLDRNALITPGPHRTPAPARPRT